MKESMKSKILKLFEEEFNFKIKDVIFYRNLNPKKSGFILYRKNKKEFAKIEFQVSYRDPENYSIILDLNNELCGYTSFEDYLEKNSYENIKKLSLLKYKSSKFCYDDNYYSSFILIRKCVNSILSTDYKKNILVRIHKDNGACNISLLELSIYNNGIEFNNAYISEFYSKNNIKPLFDKNLDEKIFLPKTKKNIEIILTILSQVYLFTVYTFHKEKFELSKESIFEKNNEEILYLIETTKRLEEIIEY